MRSLQVSEVGRDRACRLHMPWLWQRQLYRLPVHRLPMPAVRLRRMRRGLPVRRLRLLGLQVLRR
ncbi:hypothetical protein [Aeoliella sp.]|uniref:hypothetical protein n=1 Tax=Aeoliella sp. TaxID=2795800 RepID=UPI003CCC2AD9